LADFFFILKNSNKQKNSKNSKNKKAFFFCFKNFKFFFIFSIMAFEINFYAEELKNLFFIKKALKKKKNIN